MSDLREAAGRLRQIQRHGGSKYIDEVYVDYDELQAVEQVTLDEMLICDAVLPEFDETPVDEAWLRSICGSYEYDNDNSVAFYLVRQLSGDNLLSLCVSNSSGRFSCSLAKLCDGPMKDSPWIDLEVVGTRGELLSLCRALGIQLGEGT